MIHDQNEKFLNQLFIMPYSWYELNMINHTRYVYISILILCEISICNFYSACGLESCFFFYLISKGNRIRTDIEIQGTSSHCSDVTMGALAFQITSVSIVCSTVGSGADQGKHQISASLAFVRGIHRWPVNSLHKVTRKMFPFDDCASCAIFSYVPCFQLHLF